MEEASRSRGWRHLRHLSPHQGHGGNAPPLTPPPRLIDFHKNAIHAIYSNLTLPDALRLSATCKSLRKYNAFAYKKLICNIVDPDENTLRRFAGRLARFKEIITRKPHYAAQVEALAIHVSGTALAERFTNHVDGIVADIVDFAPNLHVFQWCGDSHGLRDHCPERTIATLRRKASLRDLRIQGFESPADVQQAMQQWGNVRSNLESLQRVVIRCRGQPIYWFNAFLGSAPSLQVLDFADQQETPDQHIQEFAECWQGLDTLVLSSTPMALKSYIYLMRRGLVRIYPPLLF